MDDTPEQQQREAKQERQRRRRQAGLIGIMSLIGLVAIGVGLISGLEVEYSLIAGVVISIIGAMFVLGILYALGVTLGLWSDLR